MPSNASRVTAAPWAKLDNLLVGRTLHLQSVSPLHLPQTRPLSRPEGRVDEEAGLAFDDLVRFAEELYRYLTVRLSSTLYIGDDGQTVMPERERKGSIRHVKASFVDPLPESRANRDDDNGRRSATHSIPRPWAIEMEIQPFDPQASNPYSGTAKRRPPKAQHAHVLLLSNASRANQRHYPILIWKAPPATTLAPGSKTQQAASSTANNLPIDGDAARLAEEVNAAASSTLNPRRLMGHVLDFLSRYFDCRLSHAAPLCSVRGAKLETWAESILASSRKALLAQAEEVPAIEMGYALPVQVRIEGQDAMRPDRVQPGPAPDLNLISLHVPSMVVRFLLQEATPQTPVLKLVQQYLAAHASLPLERLTLVRIGVANVYIGTPTVATLNAGGANDGAQGEVRIKIGRMHRKGSASDVADQPVESRRIATILQGLVHISERDDW